MFGLAKGPKSSVMHSKVAGGTGGIGGSAGAGKKGKSFISSMPSKAPNPYRQARTLVTRATGPHKLGKPY